MDFKGTLDEYVVEINALLNRTLSPCEELPYNTILEAMDYSLSAGGKRLRPLLTLEFCRICGGDKKRAYPFAAAIEMVHTYSLIHDDLPCMDNDDYRRGRLTNHKVYGEAMAVLAGDGLLGEAFATALSAETDERLSAAQVLACGRALADAAGCAGMLGGQVLDIESENREISPELLCQLHLQKTAALIRGAVKMGAIVGGANDEKLRAADEYAKSLGLCFQIVDDLLDVFGDAKVLGKATHMDDKNGKSTFVTLLGADAARARAVELTNAALQALDAFEDTDFLRELTKSLLCRIK